METTLFSLGLVVSIGIVVRPLLGSVMNPDALRQALGSVVLYILLPSLIFEKICSAEIGSESYQVAGAVGVGIISCLLLGTFLFGFFKIEGRTRGSLILACAFGNATCLGLPVIEEMFGSSGAPVVFLAELTVTALNLLVGVMVASLLVSGRSGSRSIVRSVGAALKLPPLWALVGALAVNLYAVPVPDWVLDGTELLGRAVAGLMLLLLGMALRFPGPGLLLLAVPVVAIKLIVSPGAVYLAARGLGMSGTPLEATVVEGAMPTQLLCLVIADRYGLDTSCLALLIVLDTALVYLTVPLVHGFLF